MVFKRRDPLSWGAWLREQIYPRSGFRRAARYVMHRMTRLPDQPHKVARGVFAGSFVGFMPLPGMQFVAAWVASRAINGNLLAALLATFNTNPITTPFFAVLAMSLGHWMLGIEKPLTWAYISGATEQAAVDLWFNIKAIFNSDVPRWDGLIQFWHDIYWPYFIGALGPALILSLIGYYITIPLVGAYQKARAAKAEDRREKRKKLRATLAEAAARLRPHRDGDKTDKPSDPAATDDPQT